MAGAQLIAYTNLVVNYRAVAAGLIIPSMVTDALAVLIGYFIIKRVTQAEGYDTLLGMVIGGSLAAWVGIEWTRHWQ